MVLFCLILLRGPESNRRLEVMSLPRYLSSTPLFHYSTDFLGYGKYLGYISLNSRKTAS